MIHEFHTQLVDTSEFGHNRTQKERELGVSHFRLIHHVRKSRLIQKERDLIYPQKRAV